MTRLIQPSRRHWQILKRLLQLSGTAGNLTGYAHLAALAVEHRATLCSIERDFGGFPHLRWRNLLAP